SPVEHLESCGYLSDTLLAVHVNYLGRDDAAILGRRNVSVVHCPRSHDYFGHSPFPYSELSGAGINICLGTDSLASTIKSRHETPALNLFAEMQSLARRRPELSPDLVLRTATIAGARALGWKGALGELTRDALA